MACIGPEKQSSMKQRPLYIVEGIEAYVHITSIFEKYRTFCQAQMLNVRRRSPEQLSASSAELPSGTLWTVKEKSQDGWVKVTQLVKYGDGSRILESRLSLECFPPPSADNSFSASLTAQTSF